MLITVFKKVYSNIRYVLLSSIISLVVFTFAVWLPNFSLIFKIVSLDSITFAKKLSVLFSLFGSIQTNFTTISASYTIAIAILFGINISMLAYYIKTIKDGSSVKAGATTGIGGLISGIFGIGCAACGTFILSSLLATVGGVGLISYLPFGGEEFGIIGVVLLGFSVYVTSKKIAEPKVCITK